MVARNVMVSRVALGLIAALVGVIVVDHLMRRDLAGDRHTLHAHELAARAIMPGRQHMNILVTIVLGVVSAILGAILWNAIFKDQSGVAWIGGVVVAIIILFLYGRFAPKTGGGGTTAAS